MKKIIILTFFLGVFFLAGNSWADLITQGQSYKVVDAEGPYPGGAFKILTTNDELITYTFCIERSEVFSPGATMLAANVSHQVINDINANPTPGILTVQAAYLFRKYITTYGLDGTSDSDMNANYQAAIWRWENEGLAGLPAGYPTGDALYNEAGSNAIANVFYGVDVVNWTVGNPATAKQSHLVYNSGNDPVPEPVSMLLFGTGLVGVGKYIRRRFKK